MKGSAGDSGMLVPLTKYQIKVLPDLINKQDLLRKAIFAKFYKRWWR
jgi:hypothetical protein